jgi:enoyl-CoA hydratase/carnithine racemase
VPYTDILYSVDDFVATITLNRPDKLNAWTSEMDADVHHAVERAVADDAVRAIVITGAGRGFCAGRRHVAFEPAVGGRNAARHRRRQWQQAG